MISIDSLHFGYKKSRPLFKNLNLDLAGGKIYGLLGKNASGKTTLLKSILGLRYPKAGSVNVMGFDPTKRALAFLQDSFLLSEEVYTPQMDIASFIKTYGLFYPKFSNQEFYQLLNEFEIPYKSSIHKLSMGQKKKVMISFALACNTRLLVMDEPTNGLDIPSKKQFRNILSHIITKNRLFIISTHQIRDLHSLIDSVLILENGKVIFSHDIARIERSLFFYVERELPSDSNILYYERVLGGYYCIRERVNDNPGLEVDLEVLFNAIISHPKEFEILLDKELA